MKDERLNAKQQEDHIVTALNAFPQGATAKELLLATELHLSERTFQRRLAKLTGEGKIQSEGQTNQLRYFPVRSNKPVFQSSKELIVFSKNANSVLTNVQRPVAKRELVGYNRKFLDAYVPNRTFYITDSELKKLEELGKTNTAGAPAGTYARQILGRLLIDLSWNSSRLEGNTYSLLDTQRLLSEGTASTEKSALETQMILNHKDAIEFIVENADDAIGFNRYTITALHALLSNNLLPDPAASGRLRSFGVGITNSVYTPTAIPQLIEELFELILQKAGAIENPFEQAFFVMAHLPYLQPFDDVNKRVSRLAANIPLNRYNLAPLSFTDVPQELYIAGLLGVYEINDVTLLKDVFLWAYERSATRYAAVRQTLGEPDPFRLKYRDQMRDLIKQIISESLDPTNASQRVKSVSSMILENDRNNFIEAVELELLSLHDGNFARYQVTPSQYNRWKKAWQLQNK